MKDLVTVKTSDFEADLAIARTYLLDNGIDCVINGEYLSIATAGGQSMKLEVREEDYKRAVELLIKGGFTKREDYDYKPD